MVDNALKEPWPHVFREVLVGDPLELHDRYAGDVIEADGDQPTVIESTETMLQPVVEASQQERAANPAASVEDAGETGTSSSARAACRRRQRTRRRAVARIRARRTRSWHRLRGRT